MVYRKDTARQPTIGERRNYRPFLADASRDGVTVQVRRQATNHSTWYDIISRINNTSTEHEPMAGSIRSVCNRHMLHLHQNQYITLHHAPQILETTQPLLVALLTRTLGYIFVCMFGCRPLLWPQRSILWSIWWVTSHTVP